MRHLKAFSLLILCFSFFAESAFVLKTKGNRAIIHLEGKKIRKGAWFKAINPQGKVKGLIQIRKTGKTKAIAVLRMGKAEKTWPLEYTNSKKARKLIKEARLKKRKAAAYKIAAKKRLAEKIRKKRAFRKLKRERRRQIASIENADHAIYQDIYAENEPNNAAVSFTGFNSDNMEEGEGQSFLGYNSQPIKVVLGAFAGGGLNSMKLKPIDTTLSGFGWEGIGFAEINIQKKFILTGFGGYKHFKIGGKSKVCGRHEPCFLKVQYTKFGGELKYVFLPNRKFDLWGGIGGSLIVPYTVNNHAGLTKESFGLHGTIGPILGANLKTGKLVFPLSIQLSLFNPPTDTTFSWSIFFRAGCGINL